MKFLIYFVATILIATLPQRAAAIETLTMDVWEPYAPPKQVDKFKKLIKKMYKKDINVVVKYVYSPNEFFDRVRANQTDIISPSHNLIHDERFNFIRKDLVIPVDKSIVTNLKGVESRYKTLTIDQNEKSFLFNNAVYWPVLTARNRNGMKLVYDRVSKELSLEPEKNPQIVK